MRAYLSSFISLIYPRICVSCQRTLVDQEENLCLHCLSDLPLTHYHEQTNNPLVEKMISVPHLKNVYTFIKYEKGGIAQKLLHELKYKGNKEIGLMLGQMFADHVSKHLDIAQIDFIIPIPLHKSKLRKRGFNQAAVIAHGFGIQIGLPVNEKVLIRTVKSKTQTKKGKTDRWINVENLFEAATPELIKGQSILIMDDVITTGATIEMAAVALTKCNPRHIYLASIATGK